MAELSRDEQCTRRCFSVLLYELFRRTINTAVNAGGRDVSIKRTRLRTHVQLRKKPLLLYGKKIL